MDKSQLPGVYSQKTDDDGNFLGYECAAGCGELIEQGDDAIGIDYKQIDKKGAHLVNYGALVHEDCLPNL